MKARLLLLALPLLGGCSLITDLVSGRDVQVTVDPVIQQRVTTYATGDSLFNHPAVDPQTIACNATSPRTCNVGEFVRVTVVNNGKQTVSYKWGCPPPFQRRQNDAWAGFATFSVCNAS